MKTCSKCGKPIENWFVECYPDKDVCFSCELWEKRKSDYSKPNVFIADNALYTIGNEDSTDPFRGFDGAKVEITFLDGRSTVVSTNLWCGGDVPEVFRDFYKNNATIKWL